MFDDDTGCCGAHFARDTVTVLGLMTFSMPVIVLCMIGVPVFFIGGLFSPRLKTVQKQLKSIIAANLQLIYKAPLNPKARCEAAGKVFRVSPRSSGVLYKCFNIAVLLLLWTVIAAGFYFGITFLKKIPGEG